MTLPGELRERLHRAFPKHRFAVLDITIIGNQCPGYLENFIVITDADSGEVVGDVSALSHGPFFLFRRFLSAYQWRDEEDVVERTETLASLFVISQRGECGKPLGKTVLENGCVCVEMLLRPEKPMYLSIKYSSEFELLDADLMPTCECKQQE